MNVDPISSSGSMKVRLPNLGLLIESSNGVHSLAAYHMALQFQQGFGDVFDQKVENLNRHGLNDVNVDVFIEDAIKREIENLARQVVMTNHLLFSVESNHRLPFSFVKQIGQSAYLASTGGHQLVTVNAQNGTMVNLDVIANGLTNDQICDSKRKEQAMKTGNVHVHCIHTNPKDRFILLSEDAAQHMTMETLRRLIGDAESSDALEQEIELQANVARRESHFDSDQDMMTLVMEVS